MMMMMTCVCAIVILLLPAAFSMIQEPSAETCNGDPNFCDLRFDQFSLPGSHSAGSGFDGDPRECTNGEVANSCTFRNQDLTITQQLDLGIRYLSLDVCFLGNECNDSVYGEIGNTRLVTCQGSSSDITFGGYAYSGSLVKLLGQIDDWMENNTGEVVGIHFTLPPERDERPAVFNGLVLLLEEMWALEMNMHYLTNSENWPTLGQAIRDNRRIFVFMDEELLNEDTMSRSWIHPPPAYSYEPTSWTRTCMPAHSCTETGGNGLIIFSGFIWRICIKTGQTICNENLYSMAEMCHDIRREDNSTVNVVLVDYPEIGVGINSVFSIVREFNTRNVRNFLGITVTTLPPVVTTAADSNDSSTDLVDFTSGTTGSEFTFTFTLTSSRSHLFGSHSIILFIVAIITCHCMFTTQ